MSSPLDTTEDLTDLDVDGVLEATTTSEVDFFQPLDEDQARNLTETIKSASEVLWVLISRAHAGKAWEALGYDSWADYVGTEFDMSRSRSYQILDQARVVQEIEAAMPEGTSVSLSEAAARDLKGVLAEVLPEISSRTEGLDPDEASDVLGEIVEEQRQRLKEERDAAYADADLDDEFFDDLDGEYHEGGGAGKGTGLRPDFDLDEDAEPPAYDDISDVDVVAIRRAVNAAHDLYSSLSALSGLPSDLEEVVDIIPKERYAQIDNNLDNAIENLGKFAEIWRERKDDTEDEGDEEE